MAVNLLYVAAAAVGVGIAVARYRPEGAQPSSLPRKALLFLAAAGVSVVFALVLDAVLWR